MKVGDYSTSIWLSGGVGAWGSSAGGGGGVFSLGRGLLAIGFTAELNAWKN